MNPSENENQILLDVRRLLCPLPVIRLQNKIKTLPPGSLITIIATDRGVLEDIPTWCRLEGHLVEDIQEINKEIHIQVKTIQTKS